MQNLIGKLSPHFVWLFALATLGLTLLVTKLVPPVTPKVMAGIYFALFGVGAAAATVITRTSALASIMRSPQTWPAPRPRRCPRPRA